MVGKQERAWLGLGAHRALRGNLSMGELGGHSQDQPRTTAPTRKGDPAASPASCSRLALQLLTAHRRSLSKASEQFPRARPQPGAQWPGVVFGQQGAAQQAVGLGGLEQARRSPGGLAVRPSLRCRRTRARSRRNRWGASDKNPPLAFAPPEVGNGG